MNPSRKSQVDTSEAQEPKLNHAESFDKWLCWNPGHTSRERAIVAHMTPDERRRFQQLSCVGGGVMGLTLFGGMAIIKLLPMYVDIGAVGQIVGLVAYIPVACFIFLGVRRSAQKFLRNTAWYKTRGWEEEGTA